MKRRKQALYAMLISFVFKLTTTERLISISIAAGYSHTVYIIHNTFFSLRFAGFIKRFTFRFGGELNICQNTESKIDSLFSIFFPFFFSFVRLNIWYNQNGKKAIQTIARLLLKFERNAGARKTSTRRPSTRTFSTRAKEIARGT